jgi:hypothetical protein
LSTPAELEIPMPRTILLLLLSLLSIRSLSQPVSFSFPLRGECSVDYWIDYLVDHDPSPKVRDARCGQLTYDGHKGTDIMLRSFSAMDSGVGVYAMADGVVWKVKDGAFDREKKWGKPDCGNYVVVLHGSYLVSYCHLKKQSILVERGAAVRRGQQLAQVGSSGQSAHPHLHIEVADQHNNTIDPIPGPCSKGNSQISWDKPPCYDTRKYAIESGFISFIPTVDTLKEGLPTLRKFSNQSNSTVCFWGLMHGLRKGDKLDFKWYDPRNSLYANVPVEWKDDLWHNYTWSYLKTPLQSGVWHVELYVNGKLYYRKQFTVTID